ncbi:hypothetical protein FNV43_RR26902 [Rhamnella rubrinervis]|uniref:UspA domain-containing protein n=1 Tax=Rhamnella rubrinervis TaxID=2594499 RepID=A0A8K0GPM8_9ROSA|nr:hypothetical protein FNV43_RR26902 [Rhamnella rubrinervis]
MPRNRPAGCWLQCSCDHHHADDQRRRPNTKRLKVGTAAEKRLSVPSTDVSKITQIELVDESRVPSIMAKIAPEEKESPSSTMLFEVVDHGMVPLQSIEEDEELSEGSLFSIDIDLHRDHDHVEDHSDGIYVAVGKNNSKSSMDALLWTLKHAIISSSSTIVYLVHVFPVIRLIPSPLGMLPKSKVNPRLVEKFVARERDNRRKLLQTYTEACSAAKVKVDTVLIESDMVAKALLDLIPTLNIRKLVVGTNKSNIRTLKSKRRSGIANQTVQNAPENCDIRIICNGNEVTDQIVWSPSSRYSNSSSLSTHEEDQELATSSSPETRSSPSDPTPLSGQVWSVLKFWARIKPGSTFRNSKTHPNFPIPL